MIPTIQVPVKNIEAYLVRGLAFIKNNNTENWNKAVDEFYDDVKDERWFWIGYLKYPSREYVEEIFGKPEVGEQGEIGTIWNKHRGATNQVIMFRELLDLVKYDDDQIVTMEVSDYVALMSFDATQNTITTTKEYYSRNGKS